MLWPRHVWWTPADAGAMDWPAECATCGVALRDESAPAIGARDAAEPPYCSTCIELHARQAGQARSLAAAASLAGVAVALAFPLLDPRADLGWHLLAAGAVALAPIAGLGGTRAFGAWRSAPRVHGLGPLGTCIERRELAERLAQGGRRLRALWLAPLVYRSGWALVPALAVGVAALTHGWHHPRLWVINLTPERLWLAVDGVLCAALEPAGSDPAIAALELRLPRGERELAAFDERHQRVASVRALLQGGRDHMYAPNSDAFCFWLESTGYGRDATHDVRPLESPARFFALDTEVDTWFAPSPEPPSHDRRSTGGTLTALRQSLCSRAPEKVRQAASAIGP